MNLLEPVIAEMLKDMEAVFQQYDIDFYLVGAIARDILLSGNHEKESSRKTEDVDIAIMLSSAEQFNILKNALLETGNFVADEKEAIKVYYKNAIEVDLLPFGDIESPYRFTHLTNPTFILHMPGFREIYPFTEEVKIDHELVVKVCTLEGIVLLKLISHSDRPERTKDLTDIEHIVSVYFDLHTELIYDDHFDLMEKYDADSPDYLQLVSAHIIGRKFQELLIESENLKSRMKIILKKRRHDIYMAMLAGLEDS